MINYGNPLLLCKNKSKLMANIDNEGKSDILNYVFMPHFNEQDNGVNVRDMRAIT